MTVNDTLARAYTVFDGYRRIATGLLVTAALAAKAAVEAGAAGPVLIFDDETGRSIDVDTRGTREEIAARLGAGQSQRTDASLGAAGHAESRARGRPKLGVVAREVTLLPRHWEWLAAQPGGASVALRKLVEEARRANRESDRIREAQERAYHFMSAMAGDLPGFEEATRALFARDRARFADQMATWPCDVREHAMRLAYGDEAADPAATIP